MPRKSAPASPAPDTFYLRNTREKDWFWINNELIDVFAPLIGPYGVAVYVCLTRRSDGNSARTQWSLRDLERVWRAQAGPDAAAKTDLRPALSRTSIARALRQLIAAGIILIEREATRSEGPLYSLPSLKQLASALTPEMREKLAVRLELSRTRPDFDDTQSVPEGYTSEQLAELLKNPGKSCGEPCANQPLSTEIPGTPVSPTDPDVSPTGHTHLIQEGRISKNYPPTPLEGGVLPVVLNQIRPGEPDHNARVIAVRQCWHFACESVRGHLLADLRPAYKRGKLRAGHKDWEHYFRDLVLESWRLDIAHGFTWIVLSAQNRHEAMTGFEFYRKTWSRALEEAFGCVPQILVGQSSKEAAIA